MTDEENLELLGGDVAALEAQDEATDWTPLEVQGVRGDDDLEMWGDDDLKNLRDISRTTPPLGDVPKRAGEKKTGVRRESPTAQLACQLFLQFGPKRTLIAFHEKWATMCPTVETPTLRTLRSWQERFHWGARARAYDEEQIAMVRQTDRETRMRQAKENAGRYQSIGQAGLQLVAMAIRDHVGDDGKLKKGIGAAYLPALMKASVDCLQMATGGPTERVGVMNTDDWDAVLAGADPETKLTLIQGLRAARTLREKKQA